MAWNCTVEPACKEEFDGVTPMDFSVTAVTVKVVEFETLPDEAEMLVVCPAVPAVARPTELIVAAAAFEDAHVTAEVMSLLLVSE